MFKSWFHSIGQPNTHILQVTSIPYSYQILSSRSHTQAGKSFASVNSRAQTGDFGEGVKLLDTNVDLPAMMMEHLRDITDRSKKLTSDIHFLRDGFRIGKIDQILEVLSNLEEGIDEAELFIEETETVMHLQLNNCHVSFDVDPHLVDQITDRKLSQSAFDRYVRSCIHTDTLTTPLTY